MRRISPAAAAALVLFLIAVVPADAAETIPTCQSQESLQQVIDGDGRTMPDDCRKLTVTTVEADGRRLCVVDLSSADEGLLSSLRSAALPEQWWVRCDRLEEAGD
jgi:hypothetical protein